MEETYFSIISEQKRLGTWDTVKHLAARLGTLDRYFFVYEFIIEQEPGKKYGYVPRILTNKDFLQRFGNQYDEPMIFKIINVMEQSIPK